MPPSTTRPWMCGTGNRRQRESLARDFSSFADAVRLSTQRRCPWNSQNLWLADRPAIYFLSLTHSRTGRKMEETGVLETKETTLCAVLSPSSRKPGRRWCRARSNVAGLGRLGRCRRHRPSVMNHSGRRYGRAERCNQDNITQYDRHPSSPDRRR